MFTRRRCLSFVLVVGLLVLAYFEPTHCVRGWLHGEAFYDGRPTSFWRKVVVYSLRINWDDFASNITWRDRLEARLGHEPYYTSYRLVSDVNANPVLEELAADPDERVAGFARDVLHGPRGAQDQGAYRPWIELLKKHNMR